jgi:hypothetical protein
MERLEVCLVCRSIQKACFCSSRRLKSGQFPPNVSILKILRLARDSVLLGSVTLERREYAEKLHVGVHDKITTRGDFL